MKSSLDTIVLRNIYAYGKNYTAPSYICFIELINNIFRFLFFLIFYILNINLKVILIICIIGTFITSLIKFDDGKYGYNKV